MSALSLSVAVIRNIYPPLRVMHFLLFSYTMFPFLKKAEKAIVKDKKVDSYVIYGVADTLTYGVGLHATAAFAVFIFHFSEAIIQQTNEKSENILKKKMFIDTYANQEREVSFLLDNTEIITELRSVRKNDIIVLRAGEVVPVDGIVVDGLAAVDKKLLTGESYPVEIQTGDKVFSSTMILNGKISVKVEASGTDTLISKLGNMLYETTNYKTNIQLKGEKWANKGTTPVMLLAALTFPYLGLKTAIVVLTCHIAQGIKVLAPMNTLSYMAKTAYEGVLIKNGAVFENLPEIDTVVFDKTGTLTDGELKVSKIITFGYLNEKQLLTFAAAGELKMSHPIARAILKEALFKDIEIPEIDDSNIKIGFGIDVKLNGFDIKIGSYRYIKDLGFSITEEVENEINKNNEEGLTYILIVVNSKISGLISFDTTIRKNLNQTIEKLRKSGIKHISIISGDRKEPTQKLAKQLSVDSYHYDVLPEDKSRLLKEFKAQGRKVCFVGDGVNDTIAMSNADVSISLKGAASLATDAANIVLMD